MVAITDAQKFYYYFPQSVAVVGVDNNVMPVAWHTPISADPPLYGILVSPKRYTYERLKKKQGFTVNFLEHDDAALIARIGGTSGRDIDKLTTFKIDHVSGDTVHGVIITRSYAAYECQPYAEQELGDHWLYVGKIVVMHVREDIVTSQGLIDVKKISPVLYFGKDRYITIDPTSLTVIKRG
jgi:flavin reductase (DIM6/NTAB) family NADH-FMN oxidoreductase RutF